MKRKMYDEILGILIDVAGLARRNTLTHDVIEQSANDIEDVFRRRSGVITIRFDTDRGTRVVPPAVESLVGFEWDEQERHTYLAVPIEELKHDD